MFEHLSIRTAQPNEADVLSAIATRTFQDTFGDSSDPADVATYLRESCSTAQFQKELADTNNTFLLAFTEKFPESTTLKTEQAPTAAPIGYAKLRRGTTEPSVTDPNSIEIERIYVEKVAIGRGVGARLMQACLDTALAADYSTIWLGVWEHNPRAIKFYERWGFTTVGSHIFRVGSDDQTDLIMQKALTQPQ